MRNKDDLLKQHKAEKDHVQSQLYQGEQRLKELNVIIATLEAVESEPEE
jgi:hypothetical protein